MIQEYSTQMEVGSLCELFNVSRSGYYRWFVRKPSKRQKANEKLVEQIRQVHDESRRTYGSRRVTVALNRSGVSCSENRVARLMKTHGIRAKKRKPFRPKTTQADGSSIAPNRLAQRTEAPNRPNEVWVSDITYIPTREGWMYLAGEMDLFSRKIVGHSCQDQMPASLVTEALNQAITHRSPGIELLHHSDQGAQYTSSDTRSLLARFQIVASMSCKGHCYDNAAMESFWATLKTEAFPASGIFETKNEAKRVIFEYIEVFYNRKRIHSSLDYLSPVDFEDKHANLN